MPPALMSSWRSRNWRPLIAAGSFARSVVARTTSVTSFAATVLIFWPWPSATFLSAGHSPAFAAVAVSAKAPLIAAATARRRQVDLCGLLCSLRMSVSFVVNEPQARCAAEFESVVSKFGSLTLRRPLFGRHARRNRCNDTRRLHERVRIHDAALVTPRDV